jgi:Tfp pilus assembly protein PilX
MELIMRRHASTIVRSPKRQRGVVLFIALIVLVAMTMAALALIRSSDTANVVAGNVAFKQAALQEADVGVDAAFAALAAGLANTSNDIAPQYYATMQGNASLGPNGAPSYINSMLAGDAIGLADVYPTYPNGVGPNGNRVRYVIERMCSPVGGKAPATSDEVTANCLTYNEVGTAADQDSHNAGRIRLTRPNDTATAVYYRITVRVDGPRNTISMAQAMVRL